MPATTFYAAEPGFRIEKIVAPATSTRSYTDTNHVVDVFGSSGGPPVRIAILRRNDERHDLVFPHDRGAHTSIPASGSSYSSV